MAPGVERRVRAEHPVVRPRDDVLDARRDRLAAARAGVALLRGTHGPDRPLAVGAVLDARAPARPLEVERAVFGLVAAGTAGRGHVSILADLLAPGSEPGASQKGPLGWPEPRSLNGRVHDPKDHPS